MLRDLYWKRIVEIVEMDKHNFEMAPFVLTASQIKVASQNLTETVDKKPRLLCKQDERDSRPQVFKDKGLFILPKQKGAYYVVKGEGYVDVPEIDTPIEDHHKKLDFDLVSSKIGDSEIQHLDFAYANSLIRTFMNDESLMLTIRGRKNTHRFTCQVNKYNLEINCVQTKVDAGYEGINDIVLVFIKSNISKDAAICQLYFPFRLWQDQTGKNVYPLFFEKRKIAGETLYYIWQFEFTNKNDFNSLRLVKSARYRIVS